MQLLAIPSLSVFIKRFFSVNHLFVISIQTFRMNFSNIVILLKANLETLHGVQNLNNEDVRNK